MKKYLIYSVLFFWIITCQATEYGNISVVRENGLYFATNVRINNVLVKGRFLIDSGSVSLLSSDIAQETGIKRKKTVTITDGYGTKESFFGKGDIEIDGITFSNVLFHIADSVDIGLGMFCSVAGIIGNNILNDKAWLFTDKDVRIISDVNQYLSSNRFSSAKLIMQGKRNTVPYVVVSFGKPRATTLIDTGDNGLLQITKNVLPYIPDSEIREGRGNAFTTLLGHQSLANDPTSSVIRTDKMIIAGMSLFAPVAHIEEDKDGWSVGTKLFDFFNVLFDFPRKKIYIREADEKPVYENIRTHGFSLMIKKDSVLVGFVWNGTSAWNKGIAPGDIILGINSLSLSGIEDMPSCEVWQLINKEMGKENISLVARNRMGKIKTFSFTREDLF